jgi:hypothetical protein
MVAIFAPAAAVHPAEVTLSWDKVVHPSVAGYRIHQGTSSRHYTRVTDVGNVTAYTSKDLQEDTTYYFSASAYDLNGNQSGLSNEISFTVPGEPQPSPPPSSPPPEPVPPAPTIPEQTPTSPLPNRSPLQPVLGTPAHGQTWCDLTPRITAGPYSDPDGDHHSKSRWQISEVNDFSTLVLDISTSRHLTQLKVPYMVLVSDTTYYARVRFEDVYGTFSDWSDAIQFTTAPQTDDIDGDGIPDSQQVQTFTDLNNDGISDADQPEVIECAQSRKDGTVVGVTWESTTNVQLEALQLIDPAEVVEEGESPGDLPLGLWAYRLRLREPGATVKVTFYSSKSPFPPGNFYKHDSITGWQDYTGHCTFNDARDSLTVELQDGGQGDSDGVANGIIVDPGGLVVSSPSSSSSNSPGACFIASAFPRHRPDRLVEAVVDALHRFFLRVLRDETSMDFH